MNKPLDPTIKSVLDKFGLDPKEALWNCHGTWCMYHRAIEQVSATAGINFEPPQVLEANGLGKSVALCVAGYTKDGRREWSTGEASPANCKNSYPYAMAEKRAKDRVALKLIGLHGLVYSEDEMPDDTPKPDAPKPDESRDTASDMVRQIKEKQTVYMLRKLATADDWRAQVSTLSVADQERVRGAYTQRFKDLDAAERLSA